jgi:uncharacterized protein YbjT (DUF2867 family)
MTAVLRAARFLGLLLCAAALGAAAAAATSSGNRPREVMVLGGTGQLGAEIVKLLVANGDHVTVFARATSDRSRLKGLPVDYATGDLMKEPDIAAALRAKKYDAVISAIRVQGDDRQFYEKIMKPLTAQARANNVGQIIHHSAVGAGRNAEKFKGLGWENVPGLLDRMRDQGVGEDFVRASGVPYTIIRNTRLYPDGTPATGKAVLTEDDTVLNSMTRADLARLTLECLGNPARLNKTYHVRDTSELAWPPPGGPR